MGLFDDAQGMIDKSFYAAKGAVSGLAVEQQACSKAFGRLCFDGWQQGWHEANGGNLSYRMKPSEVSSCRSFFYDNASSWVPLESPVGNLSGEYFMVTASGCHLRNVGQSLGSGAGIVEISSDGSAWRIVWGFTDGGMPTSELASHIAVQSVRKDVAGDKNRVLYHVHPAHVITLTKILELDSRVFTRIIWKTMLESMVVVPGGVGVVPWMVPGGAQIASTTADIMKTHEVCIWAHHGLLCTGKDYDSVFGVVQTVEKAAGIYIQSRMLQGGSDTFLNSIPDEDLEAIAKTYNLAPHESYL